MGKDILLNENGDLKIVKGDFVIDDSDNQEIEALLISVKGEFKEFPLVGADIGRLIKSRSGQTKALKEIKTQLINDGFDEDAIDIDKKELSVSAKRTE